MAFQSHIFRISASNLFADLVLASEAIENNLSKVW